MSTRSTNRKAPSDLQQVVNSVNTKNAQPDTSLYHHSFDVDYRTAGNGDRSYKRDEFINNAAKIQKLYEQNRSNASVLNNTQPTYRLSEVAEKTGLSAQYINNLIVRYGLLEPTKSKENGLRESYEFTEEEIDLINRLKHLTVQGRPFREALEFLKQDARYRRDAKRLVNALQLWSDEPTAASWKTLVSKIIALPIFEEREKHVLLYIDGEGMTLAQCAIELQLAGENDVIPILDAAYAKLGRVWMYILRLVMPGTI